jgi:hypothetical protein
MLTETDGLETSVLYAEVGEVLPQRAAMSFFSADLINAWNQSFAFTGFSFASFNTSGANQFIIAA